MKKLARRLIVLKLRLLAKAVLWRYRPRVVAVTGSVGKTTTKELTAAMLATQFRVRAAKGSFNTEFGVPLTILNQDMGFSVGHWLRVLGRGLKLLVSGPEYPEVLVLEMGADHPGDIKSLTGIAKPDVAIVTNVRGVHLVNYESVEAIAEEKSWLVRNLERSGVAVLNFDDTKVRMMQALAPGRALTYGLTDEATIWADAITQSPSGMTATIHIRDAAEARPRSYSLNTPLLGRHQLSGVLAAVAAAQASGVNPEQALAAIRTFQPPQGRLTVLPGASNLTLLDDTYNASPQAMIASLEVLQSFPGPHQAVLGSMRELGEATESGHRSVGEYVGPWLDGLVAVGDDASLIAEAAKAAGMAPDKIKRCADATEAADLVNQTSGGTVLFKASQSVYLERAVKPLLRDPRDERRLLNRLQKPEHQAALSPEQLNG